MRVTICQTSPILLDVQANLEDVISRISSARDKGAELIVFPELALTGYFVGQRFHEVALRLDSPEICRLVAATKDTAAVVGFIEESPSMNFYNSALVAVNGNIEFTSRKLNLPNYGVFEERKFFSNGTRVQVFRYMDFTIAVFICNDLWHPSLPYLGVCQNADIFITIFNSSLDSMGREFSNIESWIVINMFYSRIFGVYNVCANRVGEEVFHERRVLTDVPLPEKTSCEQHEETESVKTYRFWGGSEIINPFGQQIAKAALYEPDEISVSLSRDLLRQKRILLPYLRNDDPFFTYRELRRILFENPDA